jgi:hypothetical protein
LTSYSPLRAEEPRVPEPRPLMSSRSIEYVSSRDWQAWAYLSPQPEVHITVDKFASYQIVAQTLADLQHRGLKKIGFANNGYF